MVEVLNWILAFLITLLITEFISDLFLENYGKGKIKFKLSTKHLNPFIKKEKALIIWAVVIIFAGLVSIPIGNYFQIFVSSNIFYYIPLLSLALISFL